MAQNATASLGRKDSGAGRSYKYRRTCSTGFESVWSGNRTYTQTIAASGSSAPTSENRCSSTCEWVRSGCSFPATSRITSTAQPMPQSGSICLTPVAPHSLNIRPIVINDTAVITLDIESRSHNYLVAIDGRSERMTEETRLIIRKAPHSIKIVKQRNQRYFSTLREKLMWGADQRER